MEFAANGFQIAQATALGRAILYPEEAGSIFAVAHVEDFDPPFAHIAQAIHGVRLSGKPLDSLAVIAEMERRGTLSLAGGSAEVFRVVQYGYAPAETAAEHIALVTQRRRLAAIGTRLTQAAEDDGSDPLVLGKYAVAKAQEIVDYIEATGEDLIVPTVGEILASEDDPYDWVIPGLLERMDRLMLTGVEGVGKSMLFRQLAVCAASGIHPFTGQRHEPQHVLLVDAENGQRHVRRQIRSLVIAGRQGGGDPDSNLLVEAIPEGLDLTKPGDEAWLLRRVANLQPSMLTIGPLYRLHSGNPNDEEQARQVAAVLDRCRAAANCAVIVEAHAGHSNGFSKERPVRPVGSSLWLRWPEFGYGLRPTEDHAPPYHREVSVVSWRGDREERDWPSVLTSGRSMPWMVNRTPRLAIAAGDDEVEPDVRYGD